MAPLPKPINHTTIAIMDAFAAKRAAERGDWEGLGISISNLGEECDRSLWYSFRWASAQEKVDGKKARVFERGEIEEERLLDALELICEVERVDPTTGKQFKYRAVDGHVRGKGDGKCLGLPEAPTKRHVVECKSAANKYFGPIVKKGVEKGYFSHYVQAITYTYLDGETDRCLYMVTNKDNEEIHTERLTLNIEEPIRWLARAERIVYAAEPPTKLHEDPTKGVAFKCGFCRNRGVCHERGFSRVHCRTCLHATPMRGGDAAWNCARWGKPLSADEQRAGCPAHLFIPALVPGEVVEVDEAAETIRYRLADGSEWIDGAGKPTGDANTPNAAAESVEA